LGDFGREDLGTESTVLKAALNCSNGVLRVVMGRIIPLPCRGVYNDRPDNSMLV